MPFASHPNRRSGHRARTRSGAARARRLLVATEKEQFVPGRDPDRILLSDIVDALRTQQSGRLPIEVHPVERAARLVSEVETAIRERLSDRTLKDLIASEQ